MGDHETIAYIVKDSVEISIITGAIAPVQNMSKQNILHIS